MEWKSRELIIKTYLSTTYNLMKLQNDNIKLHQELDTSKSNIDKLITIIKNITSFTGNSIKDIFNKFLPNHLNNDDISTPNHTID